jgi:flagellar biogenesis protein FliO
MTTIPEGLNSIAGWIDKVFTICAVIIILLVILFILWLLTQLSQGRGRG